MFRLSLLAVSICSLLPVSSFAAEVDAPAPLELPTQTVLGTAQEEIKQMPGVSIITAEDIKKRPPVNDLSEIVRKMPGVNLTGNSASGTRGNNRQIDLRGMGPENTLILIDGKPAAGIKLIGDYRSAPNTLSTDDTDSGELSIVDMRHFQKK